MKTIDIGKGVTITTPLLTVEEAAVYLGISVRTMKDMPMPRQKVGVQVRYDVREIDEYLKRHRDGGR